MPDWFDDFCKILNGFQLHEKPFRERNIEIPLVNYLVNKTQELSNQVPSKLGRYDIVAIYQDKRICLELKKFASTSCLEQLDRYARNFDGLVLVCYRSTQPVRTVFQLAKPSAKIPIELIEIRRNCKRV